MRVKGACGTLNCYRCCDDGYHEAWVRKTFVFAFSDGSKCQGGASNFFLAMVLGGTLVLFVMLYGLIVSKTLRDAWVCEACSLEVTTWRLHQTWPLR